MAVGGFVTWTLVGWSWLSGTDLTTHRRRVRLAGVAAVLIAVLTAKALLTSEPLASATTPAMRRLGGDVVASLDRGGHHRVQLTFGPSATRGPSSVGWGSGLVLALEKAGITVRVDSRWDYQFGGERTGMFDRDIPTLVVTTRPEYEPTMATEIASAQTDDVGVRVLLR
jgi:hypothetical protein